MSSTILAPEPTDTSISSDRWMITIFNNEHNSFDEVINVLMQATGCDAQEAYIEAWEAHHYGKAPVHFGYQAECKKAAELITKVGIETLVTKEWNA